MNLQATQEWMKWVITDPRGASALLADIPNEIINDNAPLSAGERLDIYAEAYFARIHEALGIDFAITKALLEDEAFAKLVAEYLKAYPSREFNLNNIGENFVPFVKSYTDNTCFHDLVLLERFAVNSFYADCEETLDTIKLGALTEEQSNNLKFKLNPSVFIMHSTWPLDLLWAMKNEDNDSELVLAESTEAKSFLLFRNHQEVHLINLSSEQNKVLSLIAEGKTLGEIYEKLESAEDLEKIGAYFSEWFKNQIFSDFQF